MLLEFHGIFLYMFNLVKVKVRGSAYLVHPWKVKVLKHTRFGTVLDTIPVPGLLDHPISFPWHIFKLGEAPQPEAGFGPRICLFGALWSLEDFFREFLDKNLWPRWGANPRPSASERRKGMTTLPTGPGRRTIEDAFAKPYTRNGRTLGHQIEFITLWKDWIVLLLQFVIIVMAN